MSLSLGTRLGPYEILSKLGEGGMGEVYRARDSKLDRDVAIKVLPATFALDADRVARFGREAKTLASLNHPHIAAIYGIEEAGDTRALVMELVDGEDLSQIIARGRIALTDALPILRQIADALDAAHAQGVIHRDLKPANVKVRPDGTVKLLDFGLAKAVDPGDSSTSAVSNSPTLTARATQMGMIIGTAAYMAPEQAKGRAVDRRADVWAFGVVLYEMLTGARAFKGDDVSDTLASVLKDTPNYAALPAGTPPRIRQLLARCLERDLRLRQRDMGDVLIELNAVDGHRDEDSVASTPASPRSWLSIAAIAAGALAVGVAGGWILRRPAANAATSTAVVRLTIPAPVASDRPWPRLSPDGHTLVFVMDGRLNRRSLDSFETVAIAGTEGAAVPMISPDGRNVAFFAGGKLKRVALAGGDPTPIADLVGNSPGACWCMDDVILFSRSWATGLWSVPATGGTPKEITTPNRSKGERGHWRPEPLPNRGHVLFSIMMAGTGVNDSQIAVLDLSNGQYRTLFRGTDAQYLPSGHILYFFGGAWRLVRFDAATEQISGEPVAVLPDAFGVMPDGGSPGDIISVSQSGAVAYGPGPTAPKRDLVWMDRSLAVTPIGLPPHAITSVSLSPDGKHVAMDRIEAGAYEVWVADLGRQTEDRLDVKGSNLSPIWDRSGEWLAFVSERKGEYDAYVARIDGSGERALLMQDYDEQPMAWSSNGRIVVKQWRPDGSLPIVSVDAATGGSAEVLYQDAGAGTEVRVSPNNRWMLHQMRKGGRLDVFVRRFAPDAPTKRVSADGGYSPLWSADGREIYFRHGDTLMAASFNGDGDSPEVGVPHAILTLPPGSMLAGVDATGRFLVARLAEPAPVAGIRVVLNWINEINQLAK